MILSVIGQPVPLLVDPQELSITTPLNKTNVSTISFFIYWGFLNKSLKCKNREPLFNVETPINILTLSTFPFRYEAYSGIFIAEDFIIYSIFVGIAFCIFSFEKKQSHGKAYSHQ